MTMKHVLLAALAAMAITAHAEKQDPKISYSGLGRYSCQGNSAACAQVDANNRAQSDRDAQRYQQDQDRAQSYVDRERQKEEQRRNEQRRYWLTKEKTAIGHKTWGG